MYLAERESRFLCTCSAARRWKLASGLAAMVPPGDPHLCRGATGTPRPLAVGTRAAVAGSSLLSLLLSREVC
jgi:hypothetical protein